MLLIVSCTFPGGPPRWNVCASAQSCLTLGFPCGSACKESTCNSRDMGLIPGLGRFLGEGNGYLLQYSGLENSMDCIGDCSHEIKRCLLLGRKAVTNLDSILKSRDINLSAKVHIVKAMVFIVVMYGCESVWM